MDDQQRLAERFEQHRARLRAVAYRLLGSVSEADDAVQQAWLRLSRVDARDVDNLGAWLTTVVARVSLNMLRARQARHEHLIGVRIPEPIVSRADEIDPEREALLVESVGLAMLVVLETLAPAERLAVVLHDMFGVPFDQIGSMIGHSPSAARQLASRGRRRLRAANPVNEPDVAAQRVLVDAFLAAARNGDFVRLIEVLHPDVVLRSEAGVSAGGAALVQGAAAVARRARAFSKPGRIFVPVLVNGAAGLVSFERGKPVSVLGFTIAHGKILEIDILADPARLARLNLDRLQS